MDGRVEQHPLAALADLVTEAGNPGNRRGLAGVTAYLEAPLLSGGVELIDTPGVGSVFVDATEQALAAHEQLDAAIFVLTADRPMSASERDLLGGIAGRAVALFVVLNKVDRLSPAERDQAVRFVTDILALALPAPAPVYPVSAAAALHGDVRALNGLDVDLGAYLTERHDHDLARAVAAHALRTARASLDDVVLTLRAAELSATTTRTQVDAFHTCLHTVGQHRRDAADLVRAGLAQARRDLDEAAANDTAGIVEQVRGTVSDALDRLTGNPREIEEAGRRLAGERAAALVGSWCQARREEITQRLRDLDIKLTGGLQQDLAVVRRAADELLGLPLALPAGDGPALPTVRVDPTYQPDVGYTSDLAASLRRHLTARFGRAAVRRVLLQEVDDLAPRLVGRARAGFQDMLATAATDLTKAIDERYRDATGGLAAALAQAQTLATASAQTAAAGRAELSDRAQTLRRLIDELADRTGAPTATQPTPAASSGSSQRKDTNDERAHRLRPRGRDSRLPGPAHPVGHRDHRRRPPRPGRRALRRLHRQPRGGRAARRRPGPLRRPGRAARRGQRQRGDQRHARRPDIHPTVRSRPGVLVDLDGTATKSRLGANAIVGVSMAAARAFAQAAGQPLWRYLTSDDTIARLPVPHFNVVNGGAHAPNPLDFQEFMIAPIGAPSLAEAVRAGAEVYAALRRRLAHGGHATGLGDEGGFAPNIAAPEDVLAELVAAITDAGYTPGRDGVAIALDPAASEFYRDGAYHVAGQKLSTSDMIGRYEQIVTDFPVWSIEDGLAESDWDGWIALTERLRDRVQIVGDDLLVTNPAIVTQAIDRKAATAALIKVNQIGTVTETLHAMRLCRQAGWAQMVSHRSGETDDSFIADLAVGSGCGQLKTGAPARGERVAKYNRLIEIEADTDLPYTLG